MTSIAGSIGIMGIAAILALSNGVNAYIARTEEVALTSYPLSIQSAGMDLDDPDEGDDAADAPDGQLTTISSLAAMLRSQKTNDLAALKRFLDTDDRIRQRTAAIEYRYRLTPRIYQVPAGEDDPVVQVSPDQALKPLAPAAAASPFSSMVSLDAFHQLPTARSLYENQYRVVAGRWPTGPQDLVLVLDSHGAMPDGFEYTLGLRDHAEMDALMDRYLAGEGGGTDPGFESSAAVAQPTPTADTGPDASTDSTPQRRTYRYDQVLGRQFSLVPASSLYAYDADHQVWIDRSEQKDALRQAVMDGDRLTVVGVVRAEDTTTSLTPGLAYTPALTQHIIDQANASRIVKDQRARPDTDVFTGRSFADLASGQVTPSLDFTSLFTVDGQALRSAFTVDTDRLQAQLSAVAGDLAGGLGGGVGGDLADLAAGSGDVLPGDGIDLGGLDSSGVDLNSLAGKALDFNAETVIEGLLAGLLGVGITLLLCIPANIVVERMFDVYPIAQLPILAGVMLVAISVGLTVLAGLIPSVKAAGKIRWRRCAASNTTTGARLLGRTRPPRSRLW